MTHTFMEISNISELVWKRFNEWGLSRGYGYPRDGTLPGIDDINRVAE